MENRTYAGFWIRVGATIIDIVLMSILVYVPLDFIYGEAYWESEKFIEGFWDLMLGYVAPFLATIWFWLRFLATPGKMAARLKVVDAETGEKMGTQQAIGRYFAYILSSIPLGLGFIWIGIDKRKQGWHDKLAGTIVIREHTDASSSADTNS